MNESLDYITKHVAFLGWETECSTSSSGNKIVSVKQIEDKSFLPTLVAEFLPNIFLIRSTLRMPYVDADKIYLLIKEANIKSKITKIWLDGEGFHMVIRFQATYNGDYSTETFQLFFEAFLEDRNMIFGLDNFRGLFK